MLSTSLILSKSFGNGTNLQVNTSLRRLMEKQWIVSDPAVMMGKPVIAGTRITVELILEQLAAGEGIEQILQAHPRVTREAIQAALDFAAHALRADVVYPISEPAG